VVVCTWRDRAVVCRGVDEIVGRQAGRQVRKLNSVAGGNERESLVSETDAVVSEERENREMSLVREKDATDRQREKDGMDCWHSDCDYTRTTTSPLSRRRCCLFGPLHLCQSALSPQSPHTAQH
jgi:hypothetical protein